MKARHLSLASIGSAILASLCCIGPLLAAALGLGIFGAAAVFETLRPYLVGLTALLLGGAFYAAYYPKNQRCDGDACSAESRLGAGKTVLWFVAVLVTFVSAFPYYSPLIWKLLGRSAPVIVSTGATSAAVSAAAFRVEGMTCGGCAAAVEAALTELKGVHKANVSYEESRAAVEYDPSSVSPEEILRTIARTGFRASSK